MRMATFEMGYKLDFYNTNVAHTAYAEPKLMLLSLLLHCNLQRITAKVLPSLMAFAVC